MTRSWTFADLGRQRRWSGPGPEVGGLIGSLLVLGVCGLLCGGWVAFELAHPCQEYGPEKLVNTLCPVYGGKETLWTPCVQVSRACIRRAP